MSPGIPSCINLGIQPPPLQRVPHVFYMAIWTAYGFGIYNAKPRTCLFIYLVHVLLGQCHGSHFSLGCCKRRYFGASKFSRIKALETFSHTQTFVHLVVYFNDLLAHIIFSLIYSGMQNAQIHHFCRYFYVHSIFSWRCSSRQINCLRRKEILGQYLKQISSPQYITSTVHIFVYSYYWYTNTSFNSHSLLAYCTYLSISNWCIEWYVCYTLIGKLLKRT